MSKHGEYAEAGAAKTYEEVAADKEYFSGRLKRVYESVGMKWWMVGTADVDGEYAGEPIIPLILKWRAQAVPRVWLLCTAVFMFGLAAGWAIPHVCR